MAPLPAPPTAASASASAFLFLSPPRSRSRYQHPKTKPKPTATILCSSTATAAGSASPSLSEQLEPLSRTLLHDKPTPIADRPTPEPTWVNPTRPKPSVLSLSRHRRRSPSANTSSAPLQPLLRALRALPEDADLAGTLDAFFLQQGQGQGAAPSPSDEIGRAHV